MPQAEFQPLIVMRGKCKDVRALNGRAECKLEGLYGETFICSCEQEIPCFYGTQILLPFAQK
jgi:hypothetical protein